MQSLRVAAFAGRKPSFLTPVVDACMCEKCLDRRSKLFSSLVCENPEIDQVATELHGVPLYRDCCVCESCRYKLDHIILDTFPAGSLFFVAGATLELYQSLRGGENAVLQTSNCLV